VPALDGVRALAVGLVVGAHTYEMLVSKPALFGVFVWSPIPGGAFGVDMFFALSGFLITALLFTEYQRNGRIDFRSFYIRRALRLLPALVAVLIATSINAAITGQGADKQLLSVFGALFYYANWLQIWHVGMSPPLLHTWSLSVEEQFYIVWPAIVAWWWFRRGRPLTWLVCGYLCLSFFYRLHALFGAKPDFLLYINTFARADPLLIGALGAYIWATRRAPRRVGLLGCMGLLVVIWLVAHHGDARWLQLGGWTAMGVATTMLILAIVNGWRGAKVFAWTPFRAIGRVSYGIYLWHVPVFVFVEVEARHLPPLARVLLAYSATAVIVVLSWFCVERPFLALKPGPRARVAPPATGDVVLTEFAPQPGASGTAATPTEPVEPAEPASSAPTSP
jgi:peptidoglycan/LPS O-acetylase OafA/YrhL